MTRHRVGQPAMASKAQRDARCEYGKNRAESRENRTASDEPLNDLLAQVTLENRHLPRLE